MQNNLKTLDEHNRIVGELRKIQETGHTGIACPNCGNELFDSSPGIVLLSNPPQYRVFCRVCNWMGSRY